MQMCIRDRAEIADLKAKLAAAQGDATAAKELATQLSSKQNELKTLVDGPILIAANIFIPAIISLSGSRYSGSHNTLLV